MVSSPTAGEHCSFECPVHRETNSGLPKAANAESTMLFASLREVIQQQAQEIYCALALTCRYFYDPAMDALWEDVSSLEPILSSLLATQDPDGKVRRKDVVQTFGLLITFTLRYRGVKTAGRVSSGMQHVFAYCASRTTTVFSSTFTPSGSTRRIKNPYSRSYVIWYAAIWI